MLIDHQQLQMAMDEFAEVMSQPGISLGAIAFDSNCQAKCGLSGGTPCDSVEFADEGSFATTGLSHLSLEDNGSRKLYVDSHC